MHPHIHVTVHAGRVGCLRQGQVRHCQRYRCGQRHITASYDPRAACPELSLVDGLEFEVGVFCGKYVPGDVPVAYASAWRS